MLLVLSDRKTEGRALQPEQIALKIEQNIL